MKEIDLSANFLISLTQGKMQITTDGKPSVEFSSTRNSRIINIIDVPVKISKKPGLIKKLSQAKKLAKQLKKDDITLEIQYHGDTVLKLGKKANPKIAKIVTLSSDIEIKDLKKLNMLSKLI